MAMNIEQRLEQSAKSIEQSSQKAHDFAEKDTTLQTCSGSRDSLPKVSRIWQENFARQFSEQDATFHRQINDQATEFQNRFALSQQSLPWQAGITISDSLQRYHVGVQGEEGYKEFLPNPLKLPFETAATLADDLTQDRWLENGVPNKHWTESKVTSALEKSLGVNARIWPKDRDLVVGDVIPSAQETADGLPITHLVVNGNAYAMSQYTFGVVTEIGKGYVIVGGFKVLLFNFTSFYVDVRDFGAKLDGLSDDSDAFQSALQSACVVHIPHGNLKITKQIVSYKNEISLNGVIDQYHDGIGLQLRKSSVLYGGPGDYHVRRMSPTFKSDTASCILLWNNSSEGCIENKIDNIVVVNGKIDFSGNPQGVVDISEIQGTAVWLLAGDIYGMAEREAWEHVYRNRFTSVRADGFRYAFKLQAETLSYGTRKQNGWVNGNTFVSCSSRRCAHNIYLTCPMESDDGQNLLGECSGNFFINYDCQFSKQIFVDALYCNGRHNTFDMMLWDVPSEDSYPVVKFTKRNENLPYGFSEPSGNDLNLKGTHASTFNGGIFEINPGFNKITLPRPSNDNIFPINPLGSGQREDQSYIGVVENYIGLKNKVESFVVQRLNETQSVIGTIEVENEDRMFNPEQESYSSVFIDKDTYGVNLLVRLSQSAHIQLAGLSLAYKEFITGKAIFDFYDASDSKLASITADLTRDSSISTGRQNIANVKWFRIKIFVPQDGAVNGYLKISNIYCKAYNRRNDNYHVRRDGDQTRGDFSHLGQHTFNNQVTLGTLCKSFGDIVFEDKSKSVVFKSSNGSQFKLVVSNTGVLSAIPYIP
ncbi:glycosyl hydrolase family 28-related protein [Vibrio cholerae]|uniref:glycosyl hydrolase family 28-related protein n=1 Tax=Vibrio cholerae TaxID=666 RepID=UPI0013C2ECFC|nr:glycosyl hydrolase family 28-related protein [Vibrio cholerae]